MKTRTFSIGHALGAVALLLLTASVLWPGLSAQVMAYATPSVSPLHNFLAALTTGPLQSVSHGATMAMAVLAVPFASRATKLTAKLEAVTAQMHGIHEAAGDEPLSAEQTTQWEALKAERDKLSTSLGQVAAQAEFERAAPAVASVDGNGGAPVAAVVSRVRTAGRPRAESSGLGGFLQAVRETAVDPRSESASRLYAGAPAGASEAVDSDGGFLVQQQWGGTLLQQIYDTGILAAQVRRMSLDAEANSIKFNLLDESSRANGSRFGGIQAYWIGEGDAFTASKPKLRRIEMSPKKLIGLMYATDELLEDATALQTFVGEWFPSEFGFKLDDAIYQGTGVGQPLGIMNSPAKVTIAKEGGQAAGTINATNIEKMFAAMLPFSMSNARWYINVATLPQLFQMYHAIGTAGVPVYLPAGGISGAPFVTGQTAQASYGTLFGRPVQAIEQASALGTEGDIMFADPQRYMLCDKGPIESAASIHVKFLTDEMVFRWTIRVDGMPIPNAPLTPYKGAQTLSPFITLATR